MTTEATLHENNAETMTQAATKPEKNAEQSPAHHIDTGKRLKTYGEKKFNWITYGGFALLGNEASSLIITHARKNWSWAKKHYDPFEKFFTDMKGKRFVPEYVWNGGLPKVLVALIGGMLMVPFVKHMEDHKGEKVREYDRKHYGREHSDNDPAIVAAHQEMDEAPKQSWSSLWKGRIVTVLAAIGVDGTMGWKDAPSTKLVERITKPESGWRNYSSMDRIATQVAEKTLKLFKATPQTHPKANEYLQLGSWLLVLSSTLTLLFYGSSKLFAKKRDEKLERRQAHPFDALDTPDGSKTDEAALETALTDVAAKPQPKVSAVEHAATLNTAQPLAQGL